MNPDGTICEISAIYDEERFATDLYQVFALTSNNPLYKMTSDHLATTWNVGQSVAESMLRPVLNKRFFGGMASKIAKNGHVFTCPVPVLLGHGQKQGEGYARMPGLPWLHFGLFLKIFCHFLIRNGIINVTKFLQAASF